MPKQTSEYKKKAAEDLYMQGLSCADVGEKIGVSKRTVERWAAAGEWEDRLKAAKAAVAEKVTSLSEARDRARSRRPIRNLHGPIDELEIIDGAITTLSASLASNGDGVPANSLGSIAGGLCKLLDQRRKIAPPTAVDLAQQVIELGISPQEFVAELREQWRNKIA